MADAKLTIGKLYKQSLMDDTGKGSSQRFICYFAFLALLIITAVVMCSQPDSIPESANSLIYVLAGLSGGTGLSSQIGKLKSNK